MRLEPLCEMELDYAGGFLVIAPYGGKEGAGYGTGGGRVSGDRLTGSIQWSNHPRRREDGVLIPDAHGIIETGDGARVLFHLEGYSRVIEGEATKRSIVSPATFASEDDRYRWLNEVIAIGEGIIDFKTLTLRLQYHAAISEMT